MITFVLMLMMCFLFVLFVELVHSDDAYEARVAWWGLVFLLACVFLIITVNNGFVFVQYTVTLKANHD